MVIPELIRLLTVNEGFSIDEAIDVVSKTCAYTNHTILAEALEKWPLAYLNIFEDMPGRGRSFFVFCTGKTLCKAS